MINKLITQYPSHFCYYHQPWNWAWCTSYLSNFHWSHIPFAFCFKNNFHSFSSPPSTKCSLNDSRGEVFNFKPGPCPPAAIASLYFGCGKIAEIIVIVLEHDALGPSERSIVARDVPSHVIKNSVGVSLKFVRQTGNVEWVSVACHPITNCSLYHSDGMGIDRIYIS